MGAEELLDDELYEGEELENEESYDSSSSYSSQPNNGNKFFNNPNNRRKKNDDESSKGNVVPFRKPNSVSKEVSNLNKRVRSQAKEKPKQVNLAKPTSKNPKDFLKNSVNKAKNKMKAIHDNKKDKNQQNNNQNTDNNKNPIEQAGEEAAKKALSAALQYYRVPKVIADKLVDKYGDKAIDFVKKTTVIVTVAAIAPIILLFLVLISSIGDESEPSSKNQNISSYSEGTMSDQDFYNYLVQNGMVSKNACINEENEFTAECDVIKFFTKIKDNTDNSEQFLTIYYAMLYNRNNNKLYELYESKELESLINNKNNLKDYINGEYLITYRNDLKSDYDLYSKIEDDIYAKKVDNRGEFSIDFGTGFRMRISRAKRTNDLFYKNNSGIEGECVWYVLGRANEILDNWNKTYNWTYGPDGGDFCYADPTKSPYFQNYDIDSIEQGSIISWKFGIYGHVAIVEKVNKDSNGNVQSIEITEGGLGFYNNGPYLVGKSDNLVLYNGAIHPVVYDPLKKDIWGDSAHRQFVNKEGGWPSSVNKARRMAICDSHGTGCQSKQTLLRNNIQNYNGKEITRFCTIPLSQFN